MLANLYGGGGGGGGAEFEPFVFCRILLKCSVLAHFRIIFRFDNDDFIKNAGHNYWKV